MSLVIDSYNGSGNAGDAITIVDRQLNVDAQWQQVLLRSMRAGSAGVVVLVSGYAPYLPHVGTSPNVFDSRGMTRSAPTPAPATSARMKMRPAILRMSSTDQALEVLAALSLNKTLLAEVLRVSRPTLYDWLEGKEPNVANAQRLRSLIQLLANAGVTADDALSPRFVRESFNEAEPSLLDLLKADTIDDARVERILIAAKALDNEADKMRLDRESRLRALGFEEPSAAQRKANLATNAALREWPKD